MDKTDTIKEDKAAMRNRPTLGSQHGNMLALRAKIKAGWVLAHVPPLSNLLFF